MHPPKDYAVEIDVTEMIEDLYKQTQEINRKLDQIMYWCAGTIVAVAIGAIKLFF
jgi:hypothetical protein